LGCGADDVNGTMSESFRRMIIILMVVVVIAIIFGKKLRNYQASSWADEQFRSNMANIGNTLKNQFSKLSRHPSADSEYFLQVFGSSISATNSSISFYLKPWNTKTNKFEGFLDNWGMPLRMEMVGETNFIIRSAGPNKKYSDADDIIFNSASNNYVKP
jgi:hypothetical protein